jgi:hypothetical protein
VPINKINQKFCAKEMVVTLTLRNSFAAKTQRARGHILREKKGKKALKPLMFLNGTLIPTYSKSEDQVTKAF